MPPKKKNAKSVPKPDPKPSSPEKKEEDLPKTRTRGKAIGRTDSEDMKASKKVKKD